MSEPSPPRLPRTTPSGDAVPFRSTGVGRQWLGDLYPRLLTASWPAILLLLVAGYVLTNAIFAGLYLAGGDCINATEPGSLLQAFSFAVQTLSGIGYGAMHPTTPYAYVVSDVQAFVGLIGLALATGLMFARFSRPTSRIAFSDGMLVRQRDGVPFLVFRMANERGNQLVEATVTVVALIEERTAEGERMRRLHDLALVRSSSPMFTMSWTVLHPLDADSPVHGLARGERPPALIGVIVNVMGVDGTMNQTVHKQRVYPVDAIHFGRRFVDMVEIGADGQYTLHYGLLGETEPDPVEAARLEALRSETPD